MSLPGHGPDSTAAMTGVQRAVSSLYDAMRALNALWDPYDAPPPADTLDGFVATTNYQCRFIERSFQTALASSDIGSELRIPSSAYTSFRSIWPAAPDPAAFPRAKAQLNQFATLLGNAWVAIQKTLYGPVAPTPIAQNLPPTAADVTWFQQLQDLADRLFKACRETAFGPSNTGGLDLASQIDTMMSTALARLSPGGQQYFQLFPTTWKTFQNMRGAGEYAMAAKQVPTFLSQVSEAAGKAREASA